MLRLLSAQYLFGGLLSLIVITNPLSKIPLFISLTQNMDTLARENQAKRACIYSAAIMLVSLFAGNILMTAFGISYAALRVAGGFVVAILGYRMLFLSQDPGNAPKIGLREDYAFFPLAMPGISGPGTIAVVIGISTEIAELNSLLTKSIAFSMTFFAIAITCILMWFILKSSYYIAKRLGKGGQEVLVRLMGFLLICIGIQFVGSGIKTFMLGS